MPPRLLLLAVTASFAIILTSHPAAAQRQGRSGQRRAAPRQATSDRMNQGDPEAMRERTMQRIQQQLGTPDAEWQIVKPRLEKVMQLSRQLDSRGRAGRGPGNDGPRAARGPGSDGPRARGREGQTRRAPGARTRPDAGPETSAVQKAADELRQLLAAGTATPDQIKAKLAALRQSRETLKKNLAQARAQLQEVLTARQEATLVLMGILE